MDNANRWHCQQARRKLRLKKALDYYQQSDANAIAPPPALNLIAGKPLADIRWNAISQRLCFAIAPLIPSALEQIPLGLRGAYLVRYRDNPVEINPASVVYVSSAVYCIRSCLFSEYEGRGNPFLPILVQANPKDICFQYVQCDDPKNAEVYLIRRFSYPICN